ncbi:MAG: glyoxalase superfamily protein [Candidatus Solibacter sp.]
MSQSQRFECSAPILRVDDMQRAVKFYVDQLGFQAAQWGTAEFNYVSRDTAGIYLCRQDQGRGAAWVWLGVADVEALQAEYEARGVAIAEPPTEYPWALEMRIQDPDGNILRIGSEPRTAKIS